MNFDKVENIVENDTKDYIDYAGTRREKSDRKIQGAIEDKYNSLKDKDDKFSNLKKKYIINRDLSGNDKAIINHGGADLDNSFSMKIKGKDGKYYTDEKAMTLYKNGDSKVNNDYEQHTEILDAKNEKINKNELKDANKVKPKNLNDLKAVKDWFDKFDTKDNKIAKHVAEDFINLSNKKFDNNEEKFSFMFNVGDKIKAGDKYNKNLNGKEYTIFNKAGGINWEFFDAISKDGEVVEFRAHKLGWHSVHEHFNY